MLLWNQWDIRKLRFTSIKKCLNRKLKFCISSYSNWERIFTFDNPLIFIFNPNIGKKRTGKSSYYNAYCVIFVWNISQRLKWKQDLNRLIIIHVKCIQKSSHGKIIQTLEFRIIDLNFHRNMTSRPARLHGRLLCLCTTQALILWKTWPNWVISTKHPYFSICYKDTTKIWYM